MWSLAPLSAQAFVIRHGTSLRFDQFFTPQLSRGSRNESVNASVPDRIFPRQPKRATQDYTHPAMGLQSRLNAWTDEEIELTKGLLTRVHLLPMGALPQTGTCHVFSSENEKQECGRCASPQAAGRKESVNKQYSLHTNIPPKNEHSCWPPDLLLAARWALIQESAIVCIPLVCVWATPYQDSVTFWLRLDKLFS